MVLTGITRRRFFEGVALCQIPSCNGRELTKIFLVMRLTALLLIGFCLGASAKGYSQKITLAENNASLKTVFEKIEKQSGYNFFYRDEWMAKAKRVAINVTEAPLEDVLRKCFEDQPLTYSIVGNTIVIKQKAQERQIIEGADAVAAVDVSGIVTNESGEPLIGASVVVKGSRQGTSTDRNGQFYLAGVDERATLVISYVGYKTKEVAVNGGRSISVQLQQAPDPLNETVVIGYGTTTRRRNTGSVSSISSEEISKQPVANPLNTLQGRIPGAIVYQSNGLPGSRVTVQIRGVNSLNSGQQPLFIIDGVPFNIMDQAVPASNDINSFGIFAANRGISPFSAINPNDIERIDVLKDADATAIYGTKAANGVVLITTKKGQAGRTKVDFNVYRGAGKVSRFIPMLNTQQYLDMRKEAFANAGVTPTTANAPDLLVWDQNLNTDWQKKFLGGTANTTDAQATISGGDSRTRFLFSSGYHKETTVFPGDFSDDKISVRFTADHSSFDRKFNAGIVAGYVANNSNLLSTDLSTVYNLPPNMPTRNPDGTLFWNTNFINPESYPYQTYLGKTNNLLATTNLRYTILPGLDLKTMLSFNQIGINQNLQQPVISKNPIGTTPTHSARFAEIRQETYTIEPQATYSKNISHGRLMLLAGGTWQSSINDGTTITADNYSNAALLSSPAGAGNYTSISAPYTLYRYNSFFSRANYDWQSKYIINVNFRRDGSSRFGPGKRFGNFYSVGGAWVFSNEGFMANSLPFLSFGKIRGSYGLTGSDQIQDYQYITLFSASSGNLGYQGAPTLSPTRVNNPDLHWETNKKFEIGLDLGFLKDRILLTSNFYRNRSGNQLGFLQLSAQAGFNSYSSNFDALIENKGWEFELNTKNFSGKEFEWRTTVTLTAPSTKLLDASTQYFSFNQQALGQPLSFVLRYNYMGVDPQTGRALYKDLSKDTLTFTPVFGTDRSVIGFTAPKLYGGVNNVLSYNGVELSFFLQFSRQNGNILPGAIPGVLSTGNVPAIWLDRWRKPGDNATLPRASTVNDGNYGSSTAVWGDASYARLRNAVLAYTLPERFASKLKMSNVRIYFQGQNLITWTKNKYVSDPETIATTNQSSVVMPPLRVITAGVNVSF